MSTEAARRQKRLAQALRTNLRKRKSQIKERAQEQQDQQQPAPEPTGAAQSPALAAGEATAAPEAD